MVRKWQAVLARRTEAISWSPHPARAPTKQEKKVALEKTTTARIAGRIAAAVQTLVRSTKARVGMTGVGQGAEAALAALVGFDRGKQLTRAEIGPQRVGEIQLRIGRLIKNKVRQPHLARGSNQQVR